MLRILATARPKWWRKPWPHLQTDINSRQVLVQFSIHILSLEGKRRREQEEEMQKLRKTGGRRDSKMRSSDLMAKSRKCKNLKGHGASGKSS